MERRCPSVKGCRVAAAWTSAILVFQIWLMAAPPLVPVADEISPEAAAEIRRIRPAAAEAGSELTIEIEGANFSRGVYISFSHPAVRVLSTRRADASHLEVKLAIDQKIPPGPLKLYVSNPAGAVAETPFTVMGGTVATPLPSGAVSRLDAAIEAPVRPRDEVGTAAVPGAPEASAPPAPEVSAVDPPRAVRGSELTLRVTGKNFAPGAKVAFSNPGILVVATRVASPTELTAELKIADDAPTGPTGLFVFNPDDREVEVSFEVVDTSPSAPAAPTGPQVASAEPLRFEVFNLGEGISILENLNKPRGTLTFAAGKLRYEEAGKEVFSVAPAEIKEINLNTILGVSTGTFRVILGSGKEFNFVPASLQPAETPSIIEALRQALK